MKYLLGIAGIIVFGFAVQHFFAAWTIVLVAACCGALLKSDGFQSFLVGFCGVFLLWGIYAAFINYENEGILANRVGAMFGGLDATKLILVTAILGGIAGGLGALTGSLSRKVFT